MTYNQRAAAEMADERAAQDYDARQAIAEQAHDELISGRDMSLVTEVICNDCTDHGLSEALLLLHNTNGGNANAIRAVIDAVEAGFIAYSDREAEL